MPNASFKNIAWILTGLGIAVFVFASFMYDIPGFRSSKYRAELIVVPICGNGALETGEQCDEGGRCNGFGAACTTDTADSVCGIGISCIPTDGDDDGDGEVCSASCQLPAPPAPPATTPSPTPSPRNR